MTTMLRCPANRGVQGSFD